VGGSCAGARTEETCSRCQGGFSQEVSPALTRSGTRLWLGWRRGSGVPGSVIRQARGRHRDIV